MILVRFGQLLMVMALLLLGFGAVMWWQDGQFLHPDMSYVFTRFNWPLPAIQADSWLDKGLKTPLSIILAATGFVVAFLAKKIVNIQINRLGYQTLPDGRKVHIGFYNEEEKTRRRPKDAPEDDPAITGQG